MANNTQAFKRGLWWIRDNTNPVLPPLPGSECESTCCMNPFVLRVADAYHLYYAGAGDDGHRRICLATAPVANPTEWARHGVILDRGEDGDFDYNWCVLPHVIKFGEKWHLYYSGHEGSDLRLQAFPGIGTATADLEAKT